jgi:hypothetical protein
MVQLILIVRDVGKLKPDYSLNFELPEVPDVGSYISVQRPDQPDPFGEDLIVRKVWWRLDHPETGGFAADVSKIGSVREIYVECEVALSPYSSDDWRRVAEGAKSRGIDVEEFEVARVSFRQSDMKA